MRLPPTVMPASANARKPAAAAIAAATAATFLLPVGPLLAAPMSLDAISEGSPVTVDDAQTVGIRVLQVNVPVDFARSGGDHQANLAPLLKWGAMDGVEVSSSIPVHMGSADRTGSGDLRLGAKWKFADEFGWRPALAAELVAVAPTGRDSEGVDTALRLLATRSLGGRVWHRLHGNLIADHNARPAVGERPNRYTGVLGYDRRLTPDVMMVTDLVYAQGRERDATDRLVEIGARYRVMNDVVSFGVGRGLRSSATTWRLLASYQHVF